ncbi:hypothetical protein ACH32W_25555 [Escherichia coli]|uniref:hypothetical protein n=1 Tax=Escherichia coli TaxID=562 RepID=UPI00378A87BC
MALSLVPQGFAPNLLENEFGRILLAVVAEKATPATALTVRGCDHLQKFDSKRQPTGDMAMITRQMSHRPAWGGVHEKS